MRCKFKLGIKGNLFYNKLFGETLAYKMKKDILFARKNYKLDKDYISILNTTGMMGISIDEVFVNGFISEGVTYDYVPFRSIDSLLAKKLGEKEMALKALHVEN